jgi:hypothetical protein
MRDVCFHASVECHFTALLRYTAFVAIKAMASELPFHGA